jgi:hypothetical protein
MEEREHLYLSNSKYRTRFNNNRYLLTKLCASVGTLSRWTRLHLQSASTPVSRNLKLKAKHRFQWPVLAWVTKIYYLQLLRASEGTLSRWSWLHLQSLAPTPVSRRVVNCWIFTAQHDEEHVVPTPLSAGKEKEEEEIPTNIINRGKKNSKSMQANLLCNERTLLFSLKRNSKQ